MSSSEVARLVRFASFAAIASLAGCAQSLSVPQMPGSFFPAGTRAVAPTTADRAGSGACVVTYDGFVSYALPQGVFPPIDFRQATCAAATTIDASAPPPIPAWAAVPASTHAIFVATSLQETYSMTGMSLLEADASASGVPVTWMVGNAQYASAAGIAAYTADHAANGDDVELEPDPALAPLAAALPWYAPAVSVQGAGKERAVAALRAAGDDAFWGITWNSHGTDSTSDEGAPWGTYCADPSSYKRPAPDGSCALVSFEWTARDLTRSYFQDTNAAGYSSEAAFSTDPDDAVLRGGFDPVAAAGYERSLIDVYAAAGESQPIVVMSQQETAEEADRAATDDPIMRALYGEARRSGMAPMTLRSADSVAHGFSATPRAIAFPYLAGGAGASFDGAPFTPATIDYHDAAAGMTFVGGRTLPDRVFDYALDPVSLFDEPLLEMTPSSADYPRLLGVTVADRSLVFRFASSIAMHFGVAIWADPTALGVPSSPGLTRAGRAGYVATFDLPAGTSTQIVPCGCSSTTFSYAP